MRKMKQKTKRNALSDLAKWMEEQSLAFPVMSNQFICEDILDLENARKIHRILAELARPFGSRRHSDAFLGHIVRNCRAIAEEGE